MTTQPSLFKSPAAKQAVMNHYDSILAGWPVPYEAFTVDTCEGKTHIIASGDASKPAMILLHGGSSNSVSWGGDVADYSENYRVYAVDIPGEPGKSADVFPSYEGPAYSDWLEDVRTALKIEQFILVGLSLGGWVALKYTIAYPKRITSLVLLTTNGIIVHNELFFLKMLPLFALGKWGQQRALQMMFADIPVPEGAVEGTALIMKSIKPRRETLPLYSDEELGRLTMPVLIVGGEKDQVFSTEKIKARVNGLIPNVTVLVLPGAGHAIVQTAPDVKRFLAEKLQPA